MYSNFYLNKYFNINSYIHSLSPIYKIISLILTIISVLFMNSFLDIIIIGIYIYSIIDLTNINYKIYINNVYSCKEIVLILFIIICLFGNSIFLTLISLIYIVIYISIISMTTSLTEIIFGIESVLKSFNKIFSVNKLALIITLFFRSISLLPNEYNKIIKNINTRGLNINSLSLKEKIKIKLNLIKPMYRSLNIKNKITKNIIDIRLYDIKSSRSNYRYNEWSNNETFLLIFNILIIGIVIIF